ncbi:hypothetical protein BaRGS_00013276 [Batillaria attramentaria]|uniref:Uncharacterized protein n=1 Tax=Batillaria attramentaria TaxID=370345 RepID=A0ABD0L7W9_9CAEN
MAERVQMGKGVEGLYANAPETRRSTSRSPFLPILYSCNAAPNRQTVRPPDIRENMKRTDFIQPEPHNQTPSSKNPSKFTIPTTARLTSSYGYPPSATPLHGHSLHFRPLRHLVVVVISKPGTTVVCCGVRSRGNRRLLASAVVDVVVRRRGADEPTSIVAC